MTLMAYEFPPVIITDGYRGVLLRLIWDNFMNACSSDFKKSQLLCQTCQEMDKIRFYHITLLEEKFLEHIYFLHLPVAILTLKSLTIMYNTDLIYNLTH